MKYCFDQTPDHRYNGSIRWAQPDGRDDVLGMGTADLDFPCPPCIRDALLPICQENTYNYRFKPDSYYEAVMGWFRRKYGLALEREWLSNIPSTLGAVRLAIEKFSRPGDYVLMQAPYFTPLKAAIEGAGCQYLANPMVLINGRYELDLEDFEAKIKAYHPSLFLLVNPHNPTGRIFTRDELQSMVEICARHHVRIISDEVHFLITYDGKQHTPIFAVSEKAQDISVLIFSYSKGFNMMSLPHAMVLIANPDMRREWEQFIVPFSFGYASNPFSIAAVTAVAGGGADQWLEQVTAYLQENRDIFLRESAVRNLPITPLSPEASYLFWIDCRSSGIAPEQLGQAFLEKAGISLNNGLDHGEEGRGFVRMNFGVTRANLLLALDRIETMFKK